MACLAASMRIEIVIFAEDQEVPEKFQSYSINSTEWCVVLDKHKNLFDSDNACILSFSLWTAPRSAFDFRCVRSGWALTFTGPQFVVIPVGCRSHCSFD